MECMYIGFSAKHDTWYIVLNVFFHVLSIKDFLQFILSTNLIRKYILTEINFTEIWLLYINFIILSGVKNGGLLGLFPPPRILGIYPPLETLG